MIKFVLHYYARIAWSTKKYSLPPLILAPLARIGTEYTTPLLAATVLNKITSTQRPELSTYSGVIALYFFIPFLSEFVWRYIFWCINNNDSVGMKKIAEETFSKLMRQGYNFHTNNFAGSLVAKTNRFINAYEPLYDSLVLDVLGTFIPIIFALVVLFKLAPPVAIIFTVILCIYIFIIYGLTRKRMKLNTLRAEAESMQTGALADALSNAITVKTFSLEKHESKIYRKTLNELSEKRLKSWNYQNAPIDIITTNMIIILNTVALTGSIIATYRYGVLPGSMFIIITYVLRLTSKFWDFSRLLRNIEKNLSDAVEMANILNEKTDVTDPSDSRQLKIQAGDVTVDNIAFDYKGESKLMLFRNLTLDIPAGQRVGLVGPSGGGKTTITKLLLRFMDVREGSIKIDGQIISEVTQESLRRAITYVPQEPLLFHRTIEENIRYGKTNATKAEVISAAKDANAHEFIKNLTIGYDTLVGERGIKLSGGQRQRIAIARAILKNAPIVVLDEATSALDSESEKLIQHALLKLMENRTAIVIAHRLSTIKHLDRIIVLENGRITEDGSHDELIDLKGTYARLWAHQSGGFIEE